jgi:hypothetical protein
VREPEWDTEQQAIMVAYEAYQRLICGGCGGYLPETTEEDAAYTVDLPIRCHRCTAIAVASDAHRETPNNHALRYPARRRR